MGSSRNPPTAARKTNNRLAYRLQLASDALRQALDLNPGSHESDIRRAKTLVDDAREAVKRSKPEVAE